MTDFPRMHIFTHKKQSLPLPGPSERQRGAAISQGDHLGGFFFFFIGDGRVL